MGSPYTTFLIDAGGVMRGSISKTPDPRQPDEPDQLKVVCNGRQVTVIGRDPGRTTRVLAMARWRAGQLDRRRPSEGAPSLTDEQWTMIRNAVAKHVDFPPNSASTNGENEPPTRLFKAIVWGVLGAWAAFVFSMQYTCKGEVEPDEPPPPVAVPVRSPAPPPAEEPLETRIMKADSVAHAFALAKPTMTGAGATLFATYAASQLRWEDVDVAAETSFGHVLKDAEAERGKRMCAEGEILGIQRRDLGARKTFEGTLQVSETDAVAFVAVGTTGELIRGSKARFCGVVTGMGSRSVAIVGMFDLPENRTPIVEQ